MPRTRLVEATSGALRTWPVADHIYERFADTRHTLLSR